MPAPLDQMDPAQLQAGLRMIATTGGMLADRTANTVDDRVFDMFAYVADRIELVRLIQRLYGLPRGGITVDELTSLGHLILDKLAAGSPSFHVALSEATSELGNEA